MRVVRRGFDEVKEVTDKVITATQALTLRKAPALPIMLKQLTGSTTPATDIHRFWEQTGNFYITGQGNKNLTGPVHRSQYKSPRPPVYSRTT